MIDGLLILLGMLGLAVIVIGGITLIGAVSAGGRKESEQKARAEHEKRLRQMNQDLMTGQCTASRRGVMTKAEVRKEMESAMDWGEYQELLRQNEREAWIAAEKMANTAVEQFQQMVNTRR